MLTFIFKFFNVLQMFLSPISTPLFLTEKLSCHARSTTQRTQLFRHTCPGSELLYEVDEDFYDVRPVPHINHIKMY